MKTPRIMTGHWRTLTQEFSGWLKSHIPVPITGRESSSATTFMAPTAWLLTPMAFGCVLGCLFGGFCGCGFVGLPFGIELMEEIFMRELGLESVRTTVFHLKEKVTRYI